MCPAVRPTLKHMRWVRSSSSLCKKNHTERPIHEKVYSRFSEIRFVVFLIWFDFVRFNRLSLGILSFDSILSDDIIWRIMLNKISNRKCIQIQPKPKQIISHFTKPRMGSSVICYCSLTEVYYVRTAIKSHRRTKLIKFTSKVIPYHIHEDSQLRDG